MGQGREELGSLQFRSIPLGGFGQRLGPPLQAASALVYWGAAGVQALTKTLHFIFIAAFSVSVTLSNETIL